MQPLRGQPCVQHRCWQPSHKTGHKRNNARQARLSWYRSSNTIVRQRFLANAARILSIAPLVGVDLVHGDSIDDLTASITEGYPEQGMPAWSNSLTAGQIKTLAIYVSEERGNFAYSDFKISGELSLPTQTLHSEEYDFRVEPVIADLDPLPFSIAPLPDGRILLTEKMRGLSIISADGEQSALIEGTPKTYDDARGRGRLRYGLGWLLDVAPHPRFAENGWIYLHYTDRCSDCNEMSRERGRPVSMNTLIRGRLDDGVWVDEEIIWKTNIEAYSTTTDLGAG